MGLYDRPYWRDDAGAEPGGGFMRGISSGFPKPSKAVKWLLIINAAAFLLQLALAGNQHVHLTPWFGATTKDFWQVWRYLTFQFLHDTEGFWHIAMNMLGLYMLGTPLEQLWGPRRFLAFYLVCGATAGVAYVIAGASLGVDPTIPIVGASGGVYGLLLACAVLLPTFRVILFIFPVPIRLAALLIFGGMILMVLTSLEAGLYSGEFWSGAAHLGGALAAAVWIWAFPRLDRMVVSLFLRSRRGAWEKKLQAEADEQAQIDAILKKIHDQGLNSLTRKEKKMLHEATVRQQRRDREIDRA